MSLTIPVIESWDLDTVITQVDNLRSDECWLLDSAAAVRSAADANLDGFAGDTVSSATGGCRILAWDITIVAHNAAGAVEALTDFCAQAPGLCNELRAALDDAAAARAVAASAVVTTNTDLVSTAAKAMDASSGIVRGLPVVGGLMGMTIGVASSPEDESLKESLLIEGSGAVAAGVTTWATTAGIFLAMSTLGAASTGAAAGSVVPGAGTAVGFVVGPPSG